MEHNTPNNNEVPLIPEDQIKLPEEQFGNAPAPEPVSGRAFNPLLIILLILLLALLGVVVVWGQDLLDLAFPENITSLPTETTPVVTEESEIATMEAELDSIDMSAMEKEMNAIEAEINAEINATSTAGSTQ